jgi:RNA polymerase sigma-70 factor (ECF subfamily)
METYAGEHYREDSIENSIVEKEMEVYNTALLKEAISHLTVRQQEVIQLRFYQGFSHDQIAELLQMNHQSVSNLLYRALCSLKEKISIPVFMSFILFLLAHL